MKIGILTYHKSQNYGALLQSYATMKYLRELGYDASLIDYWPKYHQRMYKLFDWPLFKRLPIKGKMKKLYNLFFTFYRLKKRHNNTRNFVEDYLYIDRSMNYDLAIYGSDQIWRKQKLPGCEYYNPIYFGDEQISATRKIAYAGSMGVIEIENEQDTNFLNEHWKNFDAISVRESDLKELIKNISDIEAKLVLDPVFLLKKSQWQGIVDQKYIPKNKYLLYYRLQSLKDADEFVEKIAKEQNLEIIELRGYIEPFKYSKRYRLTASVPEFVSLISGAEVVVACAFHGLAMSLCFQKQVYVFSTKSQSNRMKSLLDLVGIPERLISNSSAISSESTKPIDYLKVGERIEHLAEESRNWLLNNLQ